MRSFVRHGLVVGTCLGALLASAGCSQKKATEYVTGVSTQVTVPRDLKSVRIQIATGGFVQFCQNYKVYDGKILLPRSLGNYAQSSDSNSSVVTFSIVGLTDSFEPGAATNPVFTDCTSSAPVGANNVRILRRSTQPYKPDHILFLPMALKYACFDKTCNEGETCKGGVCGPDATDPNKLIDFVDGLSDGQDGACFSTGLCMGAAIPAAPINEDTCDFAVAESKDAPVLPKDKNPFRPVCTSATDPVCTGRACTDGQCDLLPAGSPPWTGVNVEVTYDGALTKEILDLDPEEGYTIPDPAKPQIFRLAPGLCAMLKASLGPDGKPIGSDGKPLAHRITSIRASGVCAPKVASQPICYSDQLKLMGGNDDGTAADKDAASCKTKALTPSKSALALIVDDTQGHHNFFDKVSGQSILDQLAIPLKDPALVNTTIGYLYTDPVVSTCGDSRTIDFKPSATAVPALVADFNGATPGKAPSLIPGAPSLEGALVNAYNQLNALPSDYARRAVVVLGDRDLDVDTCGGDGKKPSDLAKEQRDKALHPIHTFAARIVKGDIVPDQPEVGRAITENGVPGTLPFPSNYYDATSDRKTALQNIINDLATCLYDVGEDAALLATDSTLTYANPLLATQIAIEHSGDCATQTGWTVDSSDAAHPRVKLCGQACTDYQKILGDTSSFTLLYSQAAIAVPLYVNTKACFTK